MSKAEKFADGTVVYRISCSRSGDMIIHVGRVVSLPDGEQIIVYRPAAGEIDFCRGSEDWSANYEDMIQREWDDWQHVLTRRLARIKDAWREATGAEPGAVQ